MLTEEQYKSLPCLKPDARVKLVGLHQHRALAGNPFTIQTADGHFRVPKVLQSLVKRSMEALDCYDGPDEGAVNDLLRKIAECGSKADGPHDDLTAIIGGIVDEAVAEVRSRVVEAARAHSGNRSSLVAEAMRAMAGV